MRDIIFLFCTVGIVAFEFVVGFFLTESMRGILRKDKHWYVPLFICIGLMLFLAALYSWLPGRLGAAVTIFDGALVFEDGAFVKNFGIMFGLQAFGTVLSLCRYLWSVIRKKEKLYGKVILLELAYAAVFGFICAFLVKNDQVIEIKGGKTAATIVLIVLAALGVALFVIGIKSSKKKKPAARNSQPAAPASPAPAAQPAAPASKPAPAASSPETHAAPSAQPADSPEALAEFQRVVQEKNRLVAANDYASQIPMLIKATELNVNGVLKARIWNYLGMAYGAVGSWQKALDCYRTALDCDPDSYSACTNIGSVYADHGDKQAAVEYTAKALSIAKQKGADLKNVSINYVYALAKKGDKEAAEAALGQAKQAGVDDASIAALRRIIG